MRSYPPYTEGLTQQEFLERSGVLDDGPTAIAEAKRTYRKLYASHYQKQRRKTIQPFSFEVTNGERQRLEEISRKYRVSINAYIRHKVFEPRGSSINAVTRPEVLQLLGTVKQLLQLVERHSSGLPFDSMSASLLVRIEALMQRLNDDSKDTHTNR